MLEKEKFNGRVLIFPLLEIELLKINVNLKKADVLVFTSVYALEKITMELKNFEKPVFAVGQSPVFADCSTYRSSVNKRYLLHNYRESFVAQ